MIKYTQQYLNKLEGLLKENHYEVRYEKGNFRSGYCIVEDKKVVVVNKFATIESRIQALYEIGQTLLEQGRIIHDVNKIFLRGNAAQPATQSYIADVQDEANTNEVDLKNETTADFKDLQEETAHETMTNSLVSDLPNETAAEPATETPWSGSLF